VLEGVWILGIPGERICKRICTPGLQGSIPKPQKDPSKELQISDATSSVDLQSGIPKEEVPPTSGIHSPLVRFGRNGYYSG
jgi:hypothetical protein